MKESVRFSILAVVLAVGFVGCSSSKFAKIDDPIVIGDKMYTATYTERVQPWGTSVASLHLFETEVGAPQYDPPVNYRGNQPARNAPPPVVTRTHVATVNNQGSNGWAAGAFQGSVGSGLIGGGMVWAAGRIRPSNVTATGGSGGSSSSSAGACASASAAAVGQ